MVCDSAWETRVRRCVRHVFFFFNDTATTEIYTLSLHDALPILTERHWGHGMEDNRTTLGSRNGRSEEHTSELQSHLNLVCRLLLEIKRAHHRTPSNIESHTHSYAQLTIYRTR